MSDYIIDQVVHHAIVALCRIQEANYAAAGDHELQELVSVASAVVNRAQAERQGRREATDE